MPDDAPVLVLISADPRETHRANEGMRIGLKLSQTDLANMLGVTREAVNKQLGNWAQRGLIQHTRGTVIICDPQGLKREGSPGGA